MSKIIFKSDEFTLIEVIIIFVVGAVLASMPMPDFFSGAMIGSIKSPVHQVVAWLDDLLWLVYPELCVSCDKPLNAGEKCLCTSCRFHLPKTNFHLEEVNPIIKHFWGKVKVEAAASYFLFTKDRKSVV